MPGTTRGKRGRRCAEEGREAQSGTRIIVAHGRSGVLLQGGDTAPLRRPLPRGASDHGRAWNSTGEADNGIWRRFPASLAKRLSELAAGTGSWGGMQSTPLPSLSLPKLRGQFSFCCSSETITEETKKVPPWGTAAPEPPSVRQREAGAGRKRRERRRQAGRGEAGNAQTAVPATLTACCQSSSSEAATGLWLPPDRQADKMRETTLSECIQQ